MLTSDFNHRPNYALMGQGTSSQTEEGPSFDDDPLANTLDELVLLEGHTDIVRVSCLVNNVLVTASDDCTCRLWDWRTGMAMGVLKGHTRPINCLTRLSSKRFASGSSDGKICIWNAQTGKLVRELKFHTGAVQCIVKLSENRICSGCNERILFVWDQDGNEVGRIERLENENLHCMLSVANRIVTGSSSSLLLVYNPETWSFVTILAYHRESVTCLEQVSQTQFASGSLDGAIVIWHADTLKPARILAFPTVYRSEAEHVFLYHVRSLVLLNQRYLIVAVGNGFALFDLYNGERILDKPDAHDAACLQALPLYRGRKILTCSDDSTIRLWGPAQDLDLLLRQSSSGSSSTTSSMSSAMPSSGVGSPLTASPSSISAAGNNSTSGDARDPNLSSMQKETGTFRNLFSSKKKNKVNTPLLIGEMNAHSGAVESLMAVNQSTVVSLGADGLVVIWKDGRVQRQLRNNLANASLLSHASMGASMGPANLSPRRMQQPLPQSEEALNLASIPTSKDLVNDQSDVPSYILQFALTLHQERGFTIPQVLDQLADQGHAPKIIEAVAHQLKDN